MSEVFELTDAFGDTLVPRPGFWSEDILGPGFEAQAIQLLPDEEGEVVATVVRHVPAKDPLVFEGTPETPVFRTLYIHGWNDYFYQPELARHIALAGGQFHALDLRKYGRSLRPGQTFGWVQNLNEYDEEISEALELIGDDLPVVMMAHSTGGLTATLYVAHHPGRFAGLWLNSPWLELHPSPLMRYATEQLVDVVAPRNPRRVIPTGGNNFFGDSLQGWNVEREGELPEELLPFADDPSVSGWFPNPVWKNDTRVSFAGWLAAVSNGHREIAAGLDIDCPILCMSAAESFVETEWSAEVRFRDCVLDVDSLMYRATMIGKDVTLRRFRGVHDLTLSFPNVRQQVWEATHRWLSAVFPGRADTMRGVAAVELPLAPR
ncbi:hypothetical protein HMPREF0044_0343 [Gleimia coleocanis DSM 15436]|uniref:Serine aminopeptidase S33 domain-containing protein n=1 Tax=Gleimia coleocanis DSM 15436 TaxID=525245 RepID=C0VYV3_9ACTO|nr:alpha/beta hydrolase [Gleimia coleocanis]EEH64606.1 hypothetical protein HMPREF0044_0343 [Gleimia coleocanis DSM 15436]